MSSCLEPLTERWMIMAEKSMKKRSEIEEQYQWHIEDLYKNTENWQKDFDRVKELSKELSAYEGKLSGSAHVLLEFLKKNDMFFQLFRINKIYIK